VLACGCAQPLPAPRPIVSVEGGGSVVDVRPLNEPYESVIQDHIARLRRLPGNEAVYVIQGERDGAAVIWVISVWETPRSLEQCDEAGLCSGRATMLKVLYEMTQ